MAIITSYANNTAVSDSERFLTVDDTGATKNTTASTLKGYVNTDPTFTGTVTMPESSVETADLATTAITLGHAQTTSAYITLSNAHVDLPDMSVTITAPTNGRRVEVMGFIPYMVGGASNNAVNLYIYDGATQVSQTRTNVDAGKTALIGPVFYSQVLSAGTHTFKLRTSSDVNNNVSFYASTGSPMFLTVKAV